MGTTPLNPGDILVADSNLIGSRGAVYRVDPDSGSQTMISFDGNFVDPVGVAVAANGILVVDTEAFGGGGGVIRVDPFTGIQTIVSSGGFFVEPFGIAIADNGDILVADQDAVDGRGAIIRVDPVTGLQALVSSGEFFVMPSGVAVAANGDILVADQNAFNGSGGVIRVDPATGAQSRVASGGGFNDPVGITVATNGDILVVDRTLFGAVFRVDPVTGAQTTVSELGLFAEPLGIALAANGDILVVDATGSGTGRACNQAGSPGGVIRVDPTTGAQTLFSVCPHFFDPSGIAVVPELPSISVGDVSVLEGNAGTTEATFTVTLSRASGETVTVDFATADGAAVAGDDYVSHAGRIVFNPGETSKEIIVDVSGDVLAEPTESFSINLSNADRADIADAQGVGTILTDDVTITIGDTIISEGHSGSLQATLFVSLSSPPAHTVTVRYATANGTATAGSDYAETAGTVTFLPGQVNNEIPVDVHGDTETEPDETFFVRLSEPTNATIADGEAVATILDDDAAPPTISIADVSALEGNDLEGTVRVTLTLSSPVTHQVAFWIATTEGTATNGVDYVGFDTRWAFAPGATTALMDVNIRGDALDEPNETFLIRLRDPVGATIADGEATFTIVDDDEPPPTISIGDWSAVENRDASVRITMALTSPVDHPVSVRVTTSDGTAIHLQDYLGINRIETFPAGTLVRQFDIAIVPDTLDEPDETFLLRLSDAVGAAIADGEAIATILDDDDPQPPNLTIEKVNALGSPDEIHVANGGSVEFALTVRNAGRGPTTGPITVTDVLPPQLTFSPQDRRCSAQGQTVTCTAAGPLAAGSREALTFLIRAAVSGNTAAVGETVTLFNRAIVVTPGDADLADNTSGAVLIVVHGPPPPDLQIYKAILTNSGPREAAVVSNGDLVLFRLTVSNRAGSDVGPTTGPITVTDGLDPRLSFIVHHIDSRSDARCTGSGQVVTCTAAGPLAPGYSLAFDIVTAVSPLAAIGREDAIFNAARVATAGDSEDTFGNHVTLTVVPPRLSVAKFIVPATGGPPASSVQVQPGGEVTFRFDVMNHVGSGASTGPVVVTDTLDPRLTFVPNATNPRSDPRCAAAAEVITCTAVGRFSPGMLSFEIVVRVAPTAVPAEAGSVTVTNLASVAAPDYPDLGFGENSSPEVTIEVVRGVSGALITAGGTEYRASNSQGGQEDVLVRFAVVNQPARLIADVMSDPPAPPDGNVFLRKVYDVRVEPPDAVSGPIDVCIDGGGFGSHNVLLHFHDGAWTDVTDRASSSGARMCGRADSLSPWGVGTPAASITPLLGTLPAITPVGVNDGPGDQTEPRVSEDLVSYTNANGPNPNSIRYFRFSTGVDSAIPSNGADRISDVNGDRIAFSRAIEADRRIVLFDASTSRLAEIDPRPNTDQVSAAIGGDTLAFIDTRQGNGDVISWSIATQTREVVSWSPLGEQNPNVAPNGTAIVWESCPTPSIQHCDVVKGIKTGSVWTVSAIAATTFPEAHPDTDGTWIVYDANRTANLNDRDIYFQPLAGGAETRLAMSGAQVNPSISRGVIAFESYDGAAFSDVFVYVIATNRLYQITSTPDRAEVLNDISVLNNGDVHMVWAATDSITGESDVFAATFTLRAPTDLTLAPVTVGTANVATLTATLTSEGAPVQGRTIAFNVLGTAASPINIATTNALGVATINVGLSTVPPETYPAGIQAIFSGDAEFAPSTVSVDLTVPTSPPAVPRTPIAGPQVAVAPITVNNGPGDQTDPHVSGDLVSYTSTTGSSEIRFFRFSTGADAAIPSNGTDRLSDVNGTRIAFTRDIEGNSRIFVFDVLTSSLREVYSPPVSLQLSAGLGGDTLAFEDLALGYGEVIAWNIATQTAEIVSTSPLADRNPNVGPDGSAIVWEQCPPASMTTCDIVKALRAGGAWIVSAVAATPHPEGNPDTDGAWIVYDADHMGPTGRDIYFQPLGGGVETRLELPGVQVNPSISRGVIGFESTHLSLNDVFVYVIATNTLYQITSTPNRDEVLNDISVLDNDDVRMSWAATDLNTGESDVFAATFRLGTQTDLTLAPVIVGSSNGVALTATLTSDATPLAGRSIAFTVGTATTSPAIMGTTDANGVATVAANIGTIAPGTYPGLIKARFAGDAELSPSNASADLVIPKAATTVTLTASPNPSTLGEPVIFSATVGSAFGTPAGIVRFIYEFTLRDQHHSFRFPVPVVSGVATLPLRALGSGTLSAEFLENESYLASNAAIGITVNPAPTTTTLASSRNPSLTTAPPVFTATVTVPAVPDTAIPGKVEFFGDGTLLCRSTLYQRDGASIASCGGAPLAGGTHTITARYTGIDGAALSSSAPAIQQVVREGTYFTVDLTSPLWVSSAATAISDNSRIAVNADYFDPNGNPVRHAFLFDGALSSENAGTLGGTIALASGVSRFPMSSEVFGSIVGTSSTPGNTTAHAFLYYAPNGITDLTPGGGPSAAIAINSNGLIIGMATTPSGPHAVSWLNRTMTDLGTLGGPDSLPAALSETGFIVGVASLADGSRHAAQFDSRGLAPRDLGTLGGLNSEAYAVNNAGEAVGVSDLADTTRRHAFLYDGVTMTGLGELPNSTGSKAVDINDAGFIVGTDIEGPSGPIGHGILSTPRAFLYANGTMRSLRDIAGDSEAIAINNAGMMIGKSGAHAFASNGTTITDLGTLGGFESQPAAINDAGQIVGWASDQAQSRHATLWTPVPTSALTAGPASGVVGTSVRLSATLRSDGVPIAGKTITFGLTGAHVGSATTDSAGRASFGPVSLSGIAAGVHRDAVSVSFEGDITLGPSTDSVDLTVFAQPPPVVEPTLAGIVESPVTIINDGPGDQFDPHVDGDFASYTSDTSVRFFRFSTRTDNAVPSDPTLFSDSQSDVSDGRIVFPRLRAWGNRTFTFHGTFVFDALSSTFTGINSQADYDTEPAIGGDTVALMSFRGSGFDVLSWNLADPNPIRPPETVSASPLDETNPSVAPDGSAIVWQHCRFGCDPDIFKAIRSNGAWVVSPAAAAPGPAVDPDTDGTWIVYNAFLENLAASDIYFQPLAGGPATRLAMPGVQKRARISRGVIAFVDVLPTGERRLLAYVIATNRLYQITPTPLGVQDPQLDITVLENADVRVVWDAFDTSSMNVYAKTFSLSDATPIISIQDVSVAEGTSGNSDALLTISLSAPSTRPVTVDFATSERAPSGGPVDGQYATSSDFVASSGRLTFLPGDTTRTIVVPVIGDRRDEYDEDFFLVLSNPINAITSSRPWARVAILDDDAEPSVGVTGGTVREGHLSTTQAVFTIELSEASDRALAFDVQTVDGTATTADGDYIARTDTVHFQPGQLQRTFTIDVRGDTRREVDERFFLVLLTSPFALSAPGLIVNDDHPANDAFASAHVLSGPTGEVAGIDTMGATRDPGEPNHAGSPGGASVWYRWIAPENGVVTFATSGVPIVTGGPLNTLLGVYTGSAVANLTELGASDDEPGAAPFSRVTVDVAGGTAYYIALDGFNGEMFSGDVSLLWSFAGSALDGVTARVRRGATVTTDVSGQGATPADPITTSVTNLGPTVTVSITERPSTAPPRTGFNVLGYEVSITAPASTPELPYVIVFELAATILPRGSGAKDVLIRRNGVPVAECSDPSVVRANPDPCVRALERLANGNVRITVLTSAASLWAFYTPNRPPSLELPSDLVVEATGPSGAVVTFDASADDPEQGPLAAACMPVSGSTFPLGVTTVSCSTTDAHEATTAGGFTVIVRDSTAPAIVIAVPVTGAVYRLNQVVTASYRCEDKASGVESCAGPVTAGSAIATGGVGTVGFGVNAKDRAGNVATAAATYTVAYNTCLLYDATKAKKSGSTVPITLQLCDLDGRNHSSPAVTLTALGVALVSTGDTGPAEDPGNANPDGVFRYDPTLGGVGGYIFNLKTTGYVMGTYHLRFRAGSDPTVHVAEFRVR